MKEIRLLAPTGNLGSGYLVSSLERGLAAEPSILACDSGSTDGGPGCLGSGRPYFPKAMYVRDSVHLLRAGYTHRIPVVIGSAGYSGVESSLSYMVDLLKELAAAEGLHFRVAIIHSEQRKEVVRQKLAEGKVKPLWPSKDLDPAAVDRAEHIVGMMGAEPIMAALEAGATLIIAGRASDSALFAAMPLRRGFEPGFAWHAGKILECGAAATVHRLVPDCMLGAIRDDHFVVWPCHPEMRCSTLSVAAHTLYENGDPYFLREPSGTLVTTDCRYEQVDDRSVRVFGSRFEEADPYTIKLEAAEKAGYGSYVMAGIRDPMIVGNLDHFLGEVRSRTEAKVLDSVGAKPGDYILKFRVYGRDAVMGALEPEKGTGHEVGIMIDVVAPDQDQANAIAFTARYVALHNPVPEWHGMVTNLAHPHSPVMVPRGAVYRFSMHHVVEPESPTQMFRTEYEEI